MHAERSIAGGELAIIRRMDLDWPRQELLIEWERDGAKETLSFSLAATSGPRNGKMRIGGGVRVPLDHERAGVGVLDDSKARIRDESLERFDWGITSLDGVRANPTHVVDDVDDGHV
jgi:hypothetical protein